MFMSLLRLKVKTSNSGWVTTKNFLLLIINNKFREKFKKVEVKLTKEID